MKIYQVIAHPLNCEGFRETPEVLKTYSNFQAANEHKMAWEKKWKENTENMLCVTPCWYDYTSKLDIAEIEIEDYSNGI